MYHSGRAMILSTLDRVQIARGLSDETIHHITRLNNPTSWAIIRRALSIWCINSTNTDDQFLQHFMEEILVEETIVKTLLGDQDCTIYEELFRDLVAIDAVGKASFILHATQYFTADDVYIGTSITCAEALRAGSDAGWFWIYFVSPDEVLGITGSKEDVLHWLATLAPNGYRYRTYSRVASDRWIRVLSGVREVKNAT